MISCGRRAGAAIGNTFKLGFGQTAGESNPEQSTAPSLDDVETCGSVLTPNPEIWDSKVQQLLAAGKDNAFFVLDFDRTMTKCFAENGSRGWCSHDILASHTKMSWSCKRMMELLLEKYHPIETDPNMSSEEKSPHMVEWYSLVTQMIAMQGLTQSDIAQAVEECKDFRLRAGVEELFQLAHCAGIPIIVLSAGLGNIIEEVIRQCIRKPSGEIGEEWENVKVFSNTFLWDGDGKHVGFSKPTIHPFNKSMGYAPSDVLDFIKGREHAVLCGDSMGDLTMAHGTEATNVLKLGFLNDRVDACLPKYSAVGAFDRLVLNDESFDTILDVLRTLCTVNPAHLLPSTVTPCVTANPLKWRHKVQHLMDAGTEKTFFVLDFDRTITKCFLDTGERSLGCHDILASIPKVSWQCKRTLQILLERYYPIETDPHITNEEKSKQMVDWYSMVNALLEGQELTPDDIVSAVAQCNDFSFRSGVEELFQFAHTHGIPIIILSAGLGNIIEEVVKQCFHKPCGKTGESWENVRVFSNNLLWSGDGSAQFSQPILHPFNKSLCDATADLCEFIRGRHVGILAGDGLSNLTMAIGHETTEVLKLGFLNERMDERLAKYTGDDAYDRVVLNDGGFEPILEVLRNMVKGVSA